MGTNSYGYVYDPIGDQKSAKPKAEPQGDRDFEAVRQRGARSGIPRRSGNCNRLTAAANIATNVYASNPLNQYTNIAGGSVYSPAYDADGNMLTNGVWAFVWDGENRLVSACSNGVLLVSNAYDHRSRRIRKEVSVWDPQLAAYRSQSTASFLWDNWNIIRETVAIGNTQSAVTNYYTWGVDLSGSLQGAGGVGGLLSVTTTDTNSGTSTNYYPCYDANGNVTAYLDAGGSVVAGFEYDAFGATVAASGPLGDAFTHRFSTKPFDAETGSSYYGYRHYGPEWGGWFSRDPIEEQGGLNLYGFVNNCATDKYDVWGMFFGEEALVIDISFPSLNSFDFGITSTKAGDYASNESLSCSCSPENGKALKKEIRCTLSASPVIRIDPADWKHRYFSEEKYPGLTIKDHEMNHHYVFLKVYVGAYKRMVYRYAGKRCCNCEQRLNALLNSFKRLKNALHNWEFNMEPFLGEPWIDYGAQENYDYDWGVTEPPRCL